MKLARECNFFIDNLKIDVFTLNFLVGLMQLLQSKAQT